MPIRMLDLKKLVQECQLPDETIVDVYDEYNGVAILDGKKYGITGMYDNSPFKKEAKFYIDKLS